MKRSGSRFSATLSNHSFKYSPHNAKEKKTHKFNLKREMDGVYYNLWSTDNYKTVPNDVVVIKSVYDPSPVGYSLPASNAFTGFNTIGGNVGWENKQPTPEQRAQFNAKGDYDKGWYFYTKPNKTGNTIFINVPGYRSADIIYSINAGCDYWLAGPGDSVNGFDLDLNKNFIHPLVKHSRFWGFPVRSAEEK